MAAADLKKSKLSVRSLFGLKDSGPEMDGSSEILLDENTKLMRRVAEGDVKAFECLYYRFCPILRCLFTSWGRHHASFDDFIQEIFARLWEQRRNYRGESSFQTYLLSIARNMLREKIRQSRRTARTDSEERLGFDRISHNGMSQPEAEFYLRELVAAFEAAKSRLTTQQQQALEASGGTDVLFCKASRELDCSHGALKSRLKRARRRLWELLAPLLKDK